MRIKHYAGYDWDGYDFSAMDPYYVLWTSKHHVGQGANTLHEGSHVVVTAENGNAVRIL